MDANPENVPVSDWKARRLKVGWHIRNRQGQIGVVTWISETGNAIMYRLGRRKLNGH